MMLFNQKHAAAIRMPLIDVALAFDPMEITFGRNFRHKIETIGVTFVVLAVRVDHDNIGLGIGAIDARFSPIL